MEKSYTINLETGRVELTDLDRNTYLKLEKDLKKNVTSYFIFSKYAGAWVSKSRSNQPGYLNYMVKRVLKELDLTKEVVTGEEKSFEKELEEKKEKAIRREEKYNNKADKAREEGEKLQEELNSYLGDTAFFTQPNNATVGGRRFKKQREKIYDKYHKGFEKYNESEEYKEKAKTAKATAENEKLSYKPYLVNCIDKYEASIRDIDRRLKTTNSEDYIKRLNYLKSKDEEKLDFYKNRLEELGGIDYPKEKLNKNMKVRIHQHSNIFYQIVRLNPKTVTILDSDGFKRKYKYVMIVEVKE